MINWIIVFFCAWLVVGCFTFIPRLFRRGRHER